MAWKPIIDRLNRGEQVMISPTGQSMTPLIRSGQPVTIEPIGQLPVTVGMIVLAKVRGRHYLHLVTALRKDRIQISNNHGHINGWTSRERIYGYVRR